VYKLQETALPLQAPLYLSVIIGHFSFVIFEIDFAETLAQAG